MSVEMSTQIEVVERQVFNASIQVTELLTKTLENCARDFGARCIKECALKYGFNAEEEIRALGLENLALIRKQMAKKSVGKRSGVKGLGVKGLGVKGLGVKDKKERVVKEKKSVFPMPFVAESVDMAGCCGLVFNRGLFTQCSKDCMQLGKFCKGCQTEADKNASGCPDCGTVESRLASGLYEFKDPKGRSPVAYVKVLEKLKLSSEQALEEAVKLNIELSEEHFEVVAKTVKGRPKKTCAAIEADNVTDLFAKLTAEGEDEVIEVGEDKPTKSSKKAKLSDEEKAVKKAALEEERCLKKTERDAKLAEEKAEREVSRKALLEQKKLEREAKIAEEKEEREAKRVTEKLEREAKKAAEKGSKKSVAKVETKVEAVKVEAVKVEAKVEAPTAKVSVTRIQIAGKQYLKSSNNILYNPDTREEVGLWDPESKTIKELPDDDEEEEEEEYEL
jgi:hypothetical protein